VPDMLVEKFVALVVKIKNDSYLRFDPNISGTLPVLKDKSTPLMAYIHIPFCEELCNYCSFHKVVFDENLAKEYFSALRKEIIMYKEQGYNLVAVYFGGGTPTVLMEELLETIACSKATLI